VYQASTERLYPAGAAQAKQKPAQKQSIGEAKDITRCITRTSTNHAGRPADFTILHSYSIPLSSHGTFETQDDGAHDETSHGEPCILVCQRMSTVSKEDKEGPCGKETWRKETIQLMGFI